MKLRLHGTPAECAAATERLRRTSGLHVQDQRRPYRIAAASWSASPSPSTSTPPWPGGGERLMTGPDPLGPSRRCPRAGRCEACGTTRRLEVATYQTPVGVFCATVCDLCVEGRNAPPVRSWLEAFERVGAHCEHLGIDLDQMGALLHREQHGGGDGQG
jgi:hypothetical protein